MKSSASDGSLTEQSASLPGSVEFSSADLRRVRSRALRAAARACAAETALRMIALPSVGFSSRNSVEPVVDDRAHEALHAGVAELRLRLALELRVGELRRDDRGQPLADVLAGEVVVLLLEQAARAGVAVEDGRQRRAEARQVRAALVRVDVVGEGEDRLLVGRVPLHRDLDAALVALALEEDDLAADRLLVGVEVAHEVLDAAVVLELAERLLAALVVDRDPQAAGQEGGLAQALLEHGEVQVGRLEDLGVGPERDRRAGLVGRLALARAAPAARRARSPGARRGRRGGPRPRAAPRAR